MVHRSELAAIRASINLLQRVSAKLARLGSGPDSVLVRDDCEGIMLNADRGLRRSACREQRGENRFPDDRILNCLTLGFLADSFRHTA